MKVSRKYLSTIPIKLSKFVLYKYIILRTASFNITFLILMKISQIRSIIVLQNWGKLQLDPLADVPYEIINIMYTLK